MYRQAIVIILLSLAVLPFEGCSGNKTSGELPDVFPAPAAAVPTYDSASATVRVFGAIRFKGKPEELKPVRVGGSRYCVVNTRFISSQDVLVTDDGKLQNVIVYVRSGHEAGPTPLQPNRCCSISSTASMFPTCLRS